MIVLAALLLLSHSTTAWFDPSNPRVEDRLAIADLITRHCTDIDARDYADLKNNVLLPDAFLDYSSNMMFGFRGNVDNTLKQIQDSFTMFSVTVHRWTNLRVDFIDENQARVIVMMEVPMYIYAFPVFPLFEVQAYHHLEVVKDAKGFWKIKRLTADIDVQAVHQVVFSIAFMVLLWRTRRAHQ